MGKINYSCILKSKEMFKIPKKCFHTLVPISNKIIFFELRNGPYVPQSSPIIPNWCPKLNASEIEIYNFKKNLLNKMNS